MDAQLKRLLIGMVVLMLGAGSCNLGPPPVPTSDNSAALTLQALIQTVTAQAAMTAVGAPATLSTQDFPTATELPPATAAPIVFTPTFTLVPTPTIPMVSVTKGTNCRSGPGVVYDILGGAPVGVKFLLVGKSSSTNYWIIRLQDGRECWLWGQYAVVEGNVGALPEYAIPATPLPPVGSVTGTVKSSRGQMLAGVAVHAVLAGEISNTDTNGNYRFENLPTGLEYIAVDAFSSYNAAYSPVNVGRDITLEVNLEMGESTPFASLETIEGRVLINSGPAVGANVRVLGIDANGTTDNTGRYRIDMYSGRFLVIAQLGDFRGAIEIELPTRPPPAPPNTTILPDIILSSR